MGDGNDKLLFSNTCLKKPGGYDYSIKYSDLTADQQARITNTEIKRGIAENETRGLDNINGWSTQAGHRANIGDGACALLSLINSLGKSTNSLDLSEYADIHDNKDGTYTVKFLKFTDEIAATKGRSNEITISQRQFRGVTGDLDTVVFVTALGELAVKNNPYYTKTVKNDDGTTTTEKIYFKDHPKYKDQNFTLSCLVNFYDKELSLYLFGAERPYLGWYLRNMSDEQFMNLVSNYLAEDGDLSNFNVSFYNVKDIEYYALGVEGTNHSYSLKNVSCDMDGVCYVELVNPWDDADSVKLPLSYLREIQGSNKLNIWIECLGYNATQLNNFTKQGNPNWEGWEKQGIIDLIS